MATMVERPLGALPSRSNSLRRSNSIEIIDVDNFEEPPSTSQTQRPAQRPRSRPQPSHHEAILIDSDDEIEFVASRVRSGHDVDRNRSHRRFISPAPRDPSAPPPVPPVPRRFAGQTSLPIHSQAPIIPLANPLPFERTSVPPMASPPNANHYMRAARRRGVQPSHFQPAMGLGGALISSNRIQAQQRQRDGDFAATTIRRGHRPLSLAAHRLSRDFLDPSSITDRDDDFYIHMLLNPFMNADADDFLPPRWSFNYIRRSEPQDEQYHQSYTHVSPPEPGFTFDFAVPSSSEEDASNGRFFPPTSKDEPIILDDDDIESQQTVAGPSSSSNSDSSAGSGQLSALLVCAKCLDPLVLNASLDPDEGELKRVWALRCGHLIDEKCLNILGQPPVEDAVPDKKGKGKAKAPVARRGYGVGTVEGQEEEEQKQHQEQSTQPEDTSIRSRLRSRRSTAVVSDPMHGSSTVLSSAMQETGPAPQTQETLPATKKRRVTNRKPKVEAEFEWVCPVANCGRVHVSVRINGVWGPEKEAPAGPRGGKAAGVRPTFEPRGAIAVFA